MSRSNEQLVNEIKERLYQNWLREQLSGETPTQRSETTVRLGRPSKAAWRNIKTKEQLEVIARNYGGVAKDIANAYKVTVNSVRLKNIKRGVNLVDYRQNNNNNNNSSNTNRKIVSPADVLNGVH